MVNQCIIEHVEKVIIKWRPAPIGTYLLMLYKGELEVKPFHASGIKGLLLAKLTAEDINKGLKSAKWNLIQKRLEDCIGQQAKPKDSKKQQNLF